MAPQRATTVALLAATTLTLVACAIAPPQMRGQAPAPPVEATPAAVVPSPSTPSPSSAPSASATPSGGATPSGRATPRRTAEPKPAASASSSTTPYARRVTSPTPTPSATSTPKASAPGDSQAAKRKAHRGGKNAGYPSGPNTTDRVVLTYDDCPQSLQDFKSTVLGAEGLGVRFVVFALGTCVKSGHVDVDFARQHGMYVYGHSYNHPQLTRLSDAKIRAQLQPPSVQGAWMRPPYGAANARVEQVAADAGMRLWQWNVDTNDWRKRSRAQVVHSVITESRPGDTVLMHLNWNGFSTEAIRQMKQGLEARGLELCRNTGPVSATSEFVC